MIGGGGEWVKPVFEDMIIYLENSRKINNKTNSNNKRIYSSNRI